MQATQERDPQRRGMGREDLFRCVNILDETGFRRALEIEEKRTERSQRRFVLLLVGCHELLRRKEWQDVPEQIGLALVASTRETDINGWYEQGHTTGTIFTEVGPVDGRVVTKALLERLSHILSNVLSIEQMPHVHVSFHVFPDDWRDNRSGVEVLYPDGDDDNSSKRTAIKLKRVLDIGFSLSALIFLLPLFVVLAVLIKLGSPGPVFFRQERVGRCGRRFTFLKFRSMYVNTGHELHEQFVKDLIRGKSREASANNGTNAVYKIVNDPRITPIGRFLRRTSLDELPQFINVLRGEMSLVGPRPPIPYEVDSYKTWHRRRLIRVKPGITGLWQVNGRSRVGFDDMIRLDLEYARAWSLWLDFKILLQTPRAVIGGQGAY